MSNQLWSLSWSKKQNCFHIEPLADLVRKNASAFINERTINDYHLVCIGSRDDCDEFSRAHRQLLVKRERADD